MQLEKQQPICYPARINKAGLLPYKGDLFMILTYSGRTKIPSGRCAISSKEAKQQIRLVIFKRRWPVIGP